MKRIKEIFIDKKTNSNIEKARIITNAEFNQINKALDKYKDGMFDKFLNDAIAEKYFELKNLIPYNDIKFAERIFQKDFLLLEYLRYEKTYKIVIQ